MAEEIDVEKCNFQNFTSSMTLILTLDRVDVTLVHISSRDLPTHQIRSNRKNYLWMDGWPKNGHQTGACMSSVWTVDYEVALLIYQE